MSASAETADAPRHTTAGRHVERWLGLVGSLMICLGGFAVADIPRNHPGLAAVGVDEFTYGHGKTLGAIVFWVGVALLVIAWVRMGRLIGPTGPTVADLRWTVIAWAAPLVVTVPLYSRDVYAYLGQGAVWIAGFNPYADGPAHRPGPVLDSMAQVWASTTAPYGPMFMAIARGVTEITGSHVLAGVLAMRIVLLPGLALALWAIPRLARQFGASPQAGLWLVLCNPMVLIHLVGGPHVELLMIGALVTGVVLVAQGRHLGGLVVLGLAVSIKITAGIAIPFMVWIWLAHIRSRRPVTARDVVGVFAAVIAVPVAVFVAWTAAVGLGLGWLTGLGWADQIINWFTVPTVIAHLVTLVAAPFTTLSLWPVLTVTRAIGAVVLAVILVVLWWRYRRDAQAAMVGLAWAMLAVLLLEPSTLPWYYTWALCVAVAVTLPDWARASVVGVSTFMLIVFQPDDSIVFYKLPGTLIALACATVAAISLLRPDPLRLRLLAGKVWGR